MSRWRDRILNWTGEMVADLVLGTVVLFCFLVALGAISLGESVGLTIAVVVATLALIGRYVWISRHRTGRDPESIRARERRGF